MSRLRVVCHERRVSCLRRATVARDEGGPSSSGISSSISTPAGGYGQSRGGERWAETPGQGFRAGSVREGGGGVARAHRRTAAGKCRKRIMGAHVRARVG